MSKNLSQFSRGSEAKLCGILNLTPDSFSDGGRYNNPKTALAQAKALKAAGAELLDLGAESTRPGSVPVSTKEELERLLPVIEALESEVDLPFSVDTFKADTAGAVIAAGASMINDISGLLADPKMAEVIADSEAGLILMFNPTMLRPWHPASKNFRQFGEQPAFSTEEIDFARNLPIYEQLLFFFEKALKRAEEAGIKKERIWLDPGIGFGLTAKENLSLLQSAELIHKLGYAAYFGVSRKRFLASILAEGGVFTEGSAAAQDGANVEPRELKLSPETDPRDLATASVTSYLAAQGVELLRVHNLAINYPALLVGREIARSKHSNPAQEAGEDKIFGRYN
ncbi:MAG: dihydropteroate synthase [Eubacteriales bacterium]|nr:dihydropteroate synthase [Eubacteriales bacterium]